MESRCGLAVLHHDALELGLELDLDRLHAALLLVVDDPPLRRARRDPFLKQVPPDKRGIRHRLQLPRVVHALLDERGDLVLVVHGAAARWFGRVDGPRLELPLHQAREK